MGKREGGRRQREREGGRREMEKEDLGERRREGGIER